MPDAEFTVTKAAWESQYERAEKADAALADLRAGIEALADTYRDIDEASIVDSLRALIGEA